ncbi:MAG: hypothetical protein P4M13_11105 [Alphaproteobacteria bacterium]|nr:hypothetical protein [Alphaproteobacteria bacterium]
MASKEDILLRFQIVGKKSVNEIPLTSDDPKEILETARELANSNISRNNGRTNLTYFWAYKPILTGIKGEPLPRDGIGIIVIQNESYFGIVNSLEEVIKNPIKPDRRRGRPCYNAENARNDQLAGYTHIVLTDSGKVFPLHPYNKVYSLRTGKLRFGTPCL